MRFLSALAFVSLVSSSIAPSPASAASSRLGKLRGQDERVSAQRAEAVKDAFRFAWDGYYSLAFPHDELRPVSNTFSDSRNGWGATAVDALSTALVMQVPEIVDSILEHIPTINWSVSANNEVVSLFETTIRYLGGLLSGYDLLNGPLAHLALRESDVNVLLQQAQNLANNLSFAFDTPSGIPHNELRFDTRSADDAVNYLAQIGTLVLEWTRLSDLTGNRTYGRLAQRAERYLLHPKPKAAEPWPGLVGTTVDIETGRFLDASGGWNGGDDSFYEYLIKMYVYDSRRFSSYKDRWIAAAESTIAHLSSHPLPRPDLTFLSMYSGRTRQDDSGHLACFDGGNFILGGLILRKQKYIDFGLRLVASCEDTYNQTLTKVGPEGFAWDARSVPADQTAFYRKAGYYITNSDYGLRPEMIESFYYAFRATGDPVYQDWAWNAFVAINATTRVGSGFSAITDVNEAGGGEWSDFQDSYFFAEVLKYSYLIHAADAPWQVNDKGVNQFVFNTEAHPLKVSGPLV